MSSSYQIPRAGGPTFRPAARQIAAKRRATLLGANLHQPLAWWIDPVWILLLLVLPLFCGAAYFNRYNYWVFNASRDFITPQTFGLALYSLSMMILGVLIGKLLVRRKDTVSIIDGDRATSVLVRVGWIAIVAYVILLGTLVLHLDIVLDLIRGDASAPNRLRDVLGRIPGITSFVQFGTVYLALASTLVTMTNYKMAPRLWILSAIIFGLVFIRSILASERLALLEAMAAVGVIPLAYRWRPSVWRTVAPYLGIAFVFFAFAAGEYIRSWQYYRAFYESYWDFIIPRFAGYFSTSVNNGAGTYLTMAQYNPSPEITVGWITKFPIIGDLIKSSDTTMLGDFLDMYASPEFNNPGGLYSAFLDYSFFPATLFMVLIGCVIGMVYKAFQNKSLIGFLLYPSIFLGMTDLIRIMYISDTRTLPLFLGAAIVTWAIRPVQVPRDRYLAMASGTVTRRSA